MTAGRCPEETPSTDSFKEPQPPAPPGDRGVRAEVGLGLAVPWGSWVERCLGPLQQSSIVCLVFFCKLKWGVDFSGWNLYWRLVPDLVNLGQWGPHSSHRQPAQNPARGLLTLQGTAGRFVPLQLCWPLAVAVGCAWLPGVAGVFRWCWAGGHTLGDVLIVRWGASLVGAAAGGGGDLVVLSAGLLHKVSFAANNP